MSRCIKLFQPPAFEKKPLDIVGLEKKLGGKLYYASKGRYAICHIVRSLSPRNNTVLSSPYMCPTVQYELKRLGCRIKYYDIDIRDLNPSVESVRELLKETEAATVVAPSLFGNPAALTELEEVCREANAFLIDDAAQTFGAMLDERYVGGFGDGGAIAFSPGKATAGHMGALFRTKNESYEIKRKHHELIHRVCWCDYYLNRHHIYDNRLLKLTRLCSYASSALQKYIDISNDDVERFELPILGGIAFAAENGWYEFRIRYYNEFINQFGESNIYTVVHAVRGTPNPHKIVLRFSVHDKAYEFRQFMGQRNVFVYDGYSMLSDNPDKLPNCEKVRGCIAELPIEDNVERMNFLFNCFEQYVRKCKS